METNCDHASRSDLVARCVRPICQRNYVCIRLGGASPSVLKHDLARPILKSLLIERDQREVGRTRKGALGTRGRNTKRGGPIERTESGDPRGTSQKMAAGKLSAAKHSITRDTLTPTLISCHLTPESAQDPGDEMPCSSINRS